MKQYQLQASIELRGHNVISTTLYGCLIKASWVLSDVISKHPQLSLLDSAVQLDVEALAEVRFIYELHALSLSSCTSNTKRNE